MAAEIQKRETEEEHFFALALALVPELNDRERAHRVAHYGSPREALSELGALSRKEVMERAEKELRDCRRKGFTLLTPGDGSYPALLREIDGPPLVLYVWGALVADDALSLAVVGSRRATPYGLEVCEQISTQLARRGATVISGLARGIDSAAHRAALDASGRTVAVLGSGLDLVYPREHRLLAERIAGAGAVVSELPLGTPPLPANFPRRNRIISGMSLGTVVIEAAERSGSLITARHALDQNREVFAAPGPLGAPTSVGVHRLIQDGAKLVTAASDIIEELRPEIRARLLPPAPSARAREDVRADDELSEEERKVLEALPPLGAVDPDWLTDRLGLAAHRVASALVGLELKGRARSFPGGSYGRRRG